MTNTQFVTPLSDREAKDPRRFGPKAANQALLGQSGLCTPGGFCLSSEAYRAQLDHLGLTEIADKAVSSSFFDERQQISQIRIALFGEPMSSDIQEPLLQAYEHLVLESGTSVAVRSSSIMEDTQDASFAGQFQSFLGIDKKDDFLTAIRACWGALWSSRALRYMESKEITPVDTAMAVLVQPLVDAICSGGGMSQAAGGGMSVTATWGFGESIAQGEVVPDLYGLDADGVPIETLPGRKTHSIHCARHHGSPSPTKVDSEHVSKRCLDDEQLQDLSFIMKKAEKLMERPVEIEWALDAAGFKVLQARPLHLGPVNVPDEIWLQHPSLRGQPGGIGWGTGRACVISCECELGRVAPGDVLVTKVAGPALSQVLPRVSGVVAELGGSTSHLASLARERGIPMVLGALDVTSVIPDGAQVGVDGVAGLVRWIQ